MNCPPERAQAYLVKHLEHSARDDGKSMLRLTATIGREAGTHATIEREAMATFTLAPSPGVLEYQVLIDWTPTSREPLPSFSGVFHVQWDEEYGKCRLVLEGHYQPPLGWFGKAFDAAVGHRIAQNTMRSLLGELRSVIESAYRRDIGKSS